jgi:hypothetical protein
MRSYQSERSTPVNQVPQRESAFFSLKGRGVVEGVSSLFGCLLNCSPMAVIARLGSYPPFNLIVQLRLDGRGP